MAAARRSKDVDRLLAALESPQREVARALRALILEAGPELHESVRWGVPCYRGKRYVCSIAAHSDHTNLGFFRGAALRDPNKLLEGTGKWLRHVKVCREVDLKPVPLKALLREAIAIDSS